jgi:hypothetical protein
MTPAEARKAIKKQEEELNKEITYKSKARVSKNIVDTFMQKNNAVAIKLLFYIARKHDLETKHFKDTGTIGVRQSITFELNIDDILSYCEIDRRTLRDNLKYMTRTSIEIIDTKKKEFTFISILPIATMKTKTIEVTLFREIIDQVRDVVDQYVTIDTDNLMRLKHKHTLKMVQLLELIDGFTGKAKKQKKMYLDEINGYFGTKYSRSIYIENKILKVCQKELDNYSQLTFTYEKIYEEKTKAGRPKLVGFTIFLKDNKQRQTTMF